MPSGVVADSPIAQFRRAYVPAPFTLPAAQNLSRFSLSPSRLSKLAGQNARSVIALSSPSCRSVSDMDQARLTIIADMASPVPLLGVAALEILRWRGPGPLLLLLCASAASGYVWYAWNNLSHSLEQRLAQPSRKGSSSANF